MFSKKYFKIALLIISLFVITSFGYSANAKLIICPNVGLGKAKLNMVDKEVIKLLNTKPVDYGRDTEYEGQIVYFYHFGKKDKDNNFDLEIYSDAQKKVFMFIVNTPEYATEQGIKVGSAEAQLLKIYGNKLKKKNQGGIYIKYSLGTKIGTDFYVKKGLITQIIVRNY